MRSLTKRRILSERKKGRHRWHPFFRLSRSNLYWTMIQKLPFAGSVES
jgi:hypothetical protein